MSEKPGKYDDIIHLEHHVSQKHPPMTQAERAAQFAPFAALTGYEAVVQEAARYTEQKIQLSEDQQMLLGLQLRELAGASRKPEAVFTYFLPDKRKAGGEYVATVGRLKRIDEVAQALILEGGEEIPLEDLVAVEGEKTTL